MAFGANYNFNPYVNPYAAPYQPMQQPMVQQPAQQPQNGFVWVDGIDEANNFYVAPNNAVQLWDKNAPCIYKKSADAAGKPSMQIFDLVERKPAQKTVECDMSAFATRDEITRLEARIAAVEAQNAKEKEGSADA